MKLFKLYLLIILLSIKNSISYNSKIFDKTHKNSYTFLNFKNNKRICNLLSKGRHNLGFIGQYSYFKINKSYKNVIKNIPWTTYQIDDSTDTASQIETTIQDVFPQPISLKKTGETLVFSDFSNLYKDLVPLKKDVAPQVTIETFPEKSDLNYKIENDTTDKEFLFDETSYSLSKRLFIRKLFKKIPQIIDTEQYLVRSKAYVKGQVGSKCDLSMFDSNKVKTSNNLKDEPFDSIKSILPGVFSGLHTLKHTKKRIIRELKVKVDLYVKALTSQLKNITNFYEDLLRYIHPFQYNILKTCLHEIYSTGISKISFEKLLTDLCDAKKHITFKGSEINKQINKIKKCRDAFNFVKANIFELDSIYSKFQELYNHYRHYYSYLINLPLVDIEKPIIALIGHVNVGKTTLYNKLSLGTFIKEDFKKISHIKLISDYMGLRWSNSKNNFKKLNKQAKVGNYKFTTKGINLSILTYRVNNFIYEAQLIDTPGLLWRQGHSNFNPYEKLTYSVLKDVPSGVIFCFDLTDNNSLIDQIDLYLSLKSRFPQRPWINVIAQGYEFEEKFNLLKDMGIETINPENCYQKLQHMFNSLHNILNL